MHCLRAPSISTQLSSDLFLSSYERHLSWASLRIIPYLSCACTFLNLSAPRQTRRRLSPRGREGRHHRSCHPTSTYTLPVIKTPSLTVSPSLSSLFFFQSICPARPGAASRRGEEDAVRSRIQQLGIPFHSLTEPATLDGGDVLVIGRWVYIGEGHSYRRVFFYVCQGIGRGRGRQITNMLYRR
jgi:hypothetical protein